MILASQSPRRKQLLEELGYEPLVLPADIDESRKPDESPVELVESLAAQKAEASRSRAMREGLSTPDGLLLAADTIVWDEDEVLGKPRDADDARRMLASLSGRRHHVTTGVCAMRLSAQGEVEARRNFSVTTAVEFWPLTASEIDSYVETGEPMDKAGAYGIQGLGRLLVKGIEGDYFNVVGLPVSRLSRVIKEI